MSDRNSHAYSDTSSPSQPPAWRPPKFPLPPHKLAKLANALGVPSPIPAQAPSFNSANSPALSPSHPDPLRRSPTPSSTYSHNLGYSQSISKFLLHIIPPESLLHDLEIEQSDTLPSILPNAPGYHLQFGRGVLVPMHASLQSQLGAIAKEYALPSTAGMILYLVQSVSSRSTDHSTDPGDKIGLESGPRLSEDIWRLLWARVVQVEREEGLRSPTPNMPNLRFGGYSLQELNGRDAEPSSVPPLKTPQPKAHAISPSSSSPSSVYDIRSQSKSAPPSSSSISQSEPATPDTSAALHSSPVDQFELPGLHSPSFVPILAKVEFDIDRSTAAWYEPWLRSRRMNYAKRAESHLSRKDTAGEGEVAERKAPLGLVLVDRMNSASPSPSFARSVTWNGPEPTAEGYSLLSESPQEMNSDDSDSEKDDESTTRIAKATTEEDPLHNIFGTDADTWADLRDTSQHGHAKDPNIIDLTLTSAELSGMVDESFEDDQFSERLPYQKEEDEVRDLLDAMSRPRPSVTITPSPPTSDQHQPAGTNNTTTKKHVPPPLVLPPRSAVALVDTQPSPLPQSAAGSTNLAYMVEDYDEYRGNETLFSDSSDGVEGEYENFRRLFDDKRDGGIFDGLDLGLEDLGTFDDDPYDRRKSQYVMKAKLDEIEKTLAELSPQRLKTDASVESLVKQQSSVSPLQTRPYRNMDSLSPNSIPSSSASTSPGGPAASRQSPAVVWPAIPFSSLLGEASKSRTNDPSESPRLAINGISTVMPTFRSQPSPSIGQQTETEMRKRELEEQETLYSTLSPPKSPHATSPVIPISPDPFGRYPSTVGTHNPKLSIPQWQPEQTASGVQDAPSQRRPSKERPSGEQPNQTDATSSRFSADSITVNGEAPGPKKGTTLINVKSFRNLWRKSNKASISGHIISAPVSVPSPPPMLAAPSPSEQASSERLPPIAPASAPQQHRADSALDRLHFNQESPYPVRRSPASTRPTTPNVAPPVPEKEEKERGIRKSILKSWKSPSVSLSQNSGPSPEPRTSMERPTSKSRRPSLLSLASGSSPLNSPDLPPSPHIPQQFFNARPNGTSDRRQSAKSKLTGSSVDSSHPWSPPTPPHGMTPRSHSVASSRASDETGHSFDTSQFEMVSPKVNSALSYPYHDLDHPR